MRFIITLGLALSVAAACGCGDDDRPAGDAGGGGGTDGGGGFRDAGGVGVDSGGPFDAGTGDPVCVRGCTATLAAMCPNGPATQASCESDCLGLRSGPCGTQYDALLACAEGQTLTCDGEGNPTVAACSTQQMAFVTCISSM